EHRTGKVSHQHHNILNDESRGTDDEGARMPDTTTTSTSESDAIVVGAGLAGLVAAAELVDAGKRVTILEQEPEASFGGQAWWSFGGLFLVDSPEQRRMGIKDSLELARQDWAGTAGFDRDEDLWP